MNGRNYTCLLYNDYLDTIVAIASLFSRHIELRTKWRNNCTIATSLSIKLIIVQLDTRLLPTKGAGSEHGGLAAIER